MKQKSRNDMGVYIDREKAIKCLDGNVLITRQSEAEAVREYFEMVIKRLENLPTIDLVRCKDCKHYDTESRTFPCCTDIFGAVRYMEADGFCSKGERRADEPNTKRD